MPAELVRRAVHDVNPGWPTSQVVLRGQVHEALRSHSARTLPHEACGLLIGRMETNGLLVTRAVPCPNQAPVEERHHRFVIDPRAVLNVRRTLRGTLESIVGFYHSHPDGRAVPSALDLEHIRLWPETVWVIVPMVDEEAYHPRAWWLDAGETEVRELSVRVAALSPARVTCPD